MNLDKYYITTPIYYVNDNPHIGHAYTTLIADVYARYFRKRYGSSSVFFLTGTDEHGAKVEKAAKEKGIDVKSFVDKVSQEYQNVWKKLNISYDNFIRTTDELHEKNTKDLLQKLFDKGLIYKGVYKGIYCLGCEKFLTQEEITENKCLMHPNTILREQEEENYFFRISSFVGKLEKLIKNNSYLVLPEGRKKEILSRIQGGINDISISRKGIEWGIPLPWDKGHTVYVWIDALLNYLTATKIFNKEDFWPPTIQFMAKDILWFHAVIWGALLLGLELNLPKEIFAHGFFTLDGQKMSKSTGNIIDPNDLINTFGVDGTRYLLLSAFAFGADGDISYKKFKEKYNADLANGIGNLVSRIAKLCEKVENLEIGEKISKNTARSRKIDECMDNFRPDSVLEIVWTEISKLDQQINSATLWEKTPEELSSLLPIYIEKILEFAKDLEFIIPDTSNKIRRTFCVDGKIKKLEPLFIRIQ